VESTRFVVLADDLTSAAEAAGHLADTGRPASVLLDAADTGDGWPCLDLDSRRLPEAEAAARHERATKRLWASDLGLYKTMDSSLRGNWAAELAAVLKASGRSVAVVAPACPAYDRTTVSGHQLANGVPVHLGPAGSDPVRPVTDSSVLEPLARQGIKARLLAPEDVAAAIGQGNGALVVDAAATADLDRIAKAVEGHLNEIVLCGSPGLWEALHPIQPTRRELPSARKALVLVGSLHPTTREQLAKLTSSGVPVLTNPDPQQVVQAFGTATTVAVATPEIPTAEPLNTLAAIGTHCAKAVPGLGFVLSGGDTARELAVALQINEIRAAGTVAPGIMLGTLTGPDLPVITKAGGFGGPDMLITATTALTRSVR
jgi:uncharacterized protein YgbK (DUF1537 family)